jgi:hypothetical protein
MGSTFRKIVVAVGFGTGVTGVVVAGTSAVVTTVYGLPLWLTGAMLVVAILAGTLAFTFIGQLLEMWGRELLEMVDDETDPAGSAPLTVIRDEEWRP